jgi:cation diffusion facilitator CzcD-associated flavoprotein CzcO
MNKGEMATWLVIGAGPAGIAAVGKLLDQQIPKEEIFWLDPSFQVGDLGSKWQEVSSNTKVALFLEFLNACESFRYQKRHAPFPIDRLKPDDHCLLKEIVSPLQWITDHLFSSVNAIRGEALALNLRNGCWEVKSRSPALIRAKNVILATGSEAKTLPYTHPPIIPLEVALDPKRLTEQIHPQDVVGVFGSSHSAVLALANLMNSKPKMVHNFYRSPHLFAIELNNWILFDNTGLKGFAATWAHQHLDGTLPKNLKRLLVSDETFEEVLADCNKVIYAVGFERRKLPVLEQFHDVNYQETTGIIAPGLFGLGIAYPQLKFDPLGNREYRVGLWKFMDYLNSILPIWLKYAN